MLRISVFGLPVILASLGLVTACGSDADAPSPSSSEPTEGEITPKTPKLATPASEATPTPIASLQVASGNVIEVYDFDIGALVVESGKAYTQPTLQLKGKHTASDLGAIWRSIAPGQAVPEALLSLEHRLTRLPSGTQVTKPTISVVDGMEEAVPEVDPGGSLLAAPSGCNNGCCDYQWLSTFFVCNPSDVDYKWFLFNYIWSTYKGSDKMYYNSLVCAATGQSEYKVTIPGKGGTWSIPEAHYKQYWWLAGSSCDPICGIDDEDVKASVNSSTNPHLHTFCGYVLND